MILEGVVSMKINISFSSDWNDEFLQKMEHDGPWGNWDLYKLAVEMEENHHYS